VDIEEHLALHRDKIREIASGLAYYDSDGTDEAEQIIMVLMWERHESGAYNHHWPDPYRPGEYVSLLGYVRPYLRGIVKEALSEYKHFEKDEKRRPIIVVVPNADYDNEDEVNDSLEKLQELAQLQGRDRDYLELLYDEPMPGLKTPLESTLSRENQELVEKLLANLTEEERDILDASVGRSERRAAEFLRAKGYRNMSDTNYWRKLKAAKAKAQGLTQGL
jgi:hypothetical protein